MTATVVRNVLVTRMTGSTPKAVGCGDPNVVTVCALALVTESATTIATTAKVFIATSPELNANPKLANNRHEIMTASRALAPLCPRLSPLALGRAGLTRQRKMRPIRKYTRARADRRL